MPDESHERQTDQEHPECPAQPERLAHPALPEQTERKARTRCWEHRGCEGIDGLNDPLLQECPHGRTDCYSPCVMECQFAQCSNPWHRVATDFSILLDVTVDRSAAIKKCCQVCEYFLTQGPRIGEVEHRELPRSATPNSDSNVTVHVF